MDDLRVLRVETDCGNCSQKCCSQPFDWVFLTQREIERLETASGVPAKDFVVSRRNGTTGHLFRQLRLPCRFLDVNSGMCTVYESRPLSCQLFPFNVEVSTGQITLLGSQCGANLRVLPANGHSGHGLAENEERLREWFSNLWAEASTNPPK